jgi:hypothetical protein
MITASTEQKIIARCRECCKHFHLDQVYLARAMGPRRHYLAGCGLPAFENPEQAALSDKLVVHWQGALSPEQEKHLVRCFRGLKEKVEQELSKHK